MSTVFTEKLHAAAFIIDEEEVNYSRDVLTIKAGSGVLNPGTVLGQIVEGTATVAAKAGGNTGNGVFTLDATAPIQAGAKVGAYAITCIAAAVNGGTFRVEDPDGYVLGDIAVGATFSDDIKFSIADGATDFVVGDAFVVTIAAGSKKWVPSPDVATDGSQIAKAILIYPCDASSSDVPVSCIVRAATVNKTLLAYDASVNDATKTAAKLDQLRAALIIPR